MKTDRQRHSAMAKDAAGIDLSAFSADLLEPPPRIMSALMASLVATVAAFLVWSALAHIEEVTRGVGRVIPASKIQVVQNLEGGIVSEILTREGAIVKAGDVLLRIDPTQSGASLGETEEKIYGLRVLIERLRAEIDDRPLAFPSDLSGKRPDLVALQVDHFKTRRRELDGALKVLELQEQQRRQEVREAEARVQSLVRARAIAENELELIRSMVKDQAASRTELLGSEAKVNDIRGALTATELALPRLRAAHEEIANRRSERLQAYRGETLQRFAAAQVELSALQETSRGNRDRVERTTVRAPAAGIIKTLSITTAGQVVQPGHSLVEIVPLNDALLVEAQVRPQDIAFLRPGQEALVKLTAYDFALYGGLKGRLEQIGADSITNEKGDSHYTIRVRTEKGYLENRGKAFPIIPGMVAEVDVKTGSKTVLGYLVKPLVRMRDSALTER